MFPFKSTSVRTAFATLFLLAIGGTSMLQAQPQYPQGENPNAQPETQTISGELVGIESSGRSKLLTLKTKDGEEKKFPISGRTPVDIVGRADASMLRKGFYVEAVVNRPNANNLTGESFTVHPLLKGRMPAGKFVKAPPKAGQSKNTYYLSGVISGRAEDDEYEGYEALQVSLNSRQNVKLLFRQDVPVKLSFSDSSMIEEGAQVRVEGAQRGGRAIVTGVTFTLDKTFKPEDFKEGGDKDSDSDEEKDEKEMKKEESEES